MLIKNIEVVDRYKQIKHAIFHFSRQINAVFDYSSFGLIHLFLIHFLLLFPFSSILFKNIDIFPGVISQVFRFLLFTNLTNIFNMDMTIIYVVSIAFQTIVVCSVAAHFLFGSVFPIVTKYLGFSIKFCQYLIVPYIDLLVVSFKDMIDFSDGPTLTILGTLNFILCAPCLAVILVCVKFELRIMRKKNIFWNLDNNVHFYATLFLLFKTTVVTLNNVSISLCLLSLGVWFYHRSLKGGCIGRRQKIIEYSIYNYVAAADLAALIYLIWNDNRWALGTWIILVIYELMHCVLALFGQKIDKLRLPDCDSSPQQFYNFYYGYKEPFKSDQSHLNNDIKGQYQKVYYLHKVGCKSTKCQLQYICDRSSFGEIEQLITGIIQNKKNECMDNRIVSQLWNLQLGKKCAVEILADKPLDFKQEFTIYCIQKLTKDSQVTTKNSESNKTIISKLFYDLIFEISSRYSQFYEQLARTHPKVNSIVDSGTTICIKIQKLKTAYAGLLKSKLINFKMIELYMQFLTNFGGENALDKDDIGRLMKAQQNIYFQDISQNYLPTISLYLETGTIQNANSEAQKLLYSTRFELKYKNISDITCPSITIDKLKQVVSKEAVDAKDDPIYSFFWLSDKEYGFASIIFEERMLRQKKLMVMQMIRLKFSDQKNYFLVSTGFDLKVTIRKIVKVKSGGFKAHPLVLHWQQLFQKYIRTNQDKIVNSKMVKIPTAVNQCILVVKRLRCLMEGHFILEGQVFVTSELMRKNRNSILSFRRSFQEKKFKFDFQFQVGSNQDNAKLTFYGLKGNINGESFFFDKKLSLPPECKKIQDQLVSSIVDQKNKDYAQDIKTYRLFNRQLYNVDLQDRQAYNNLFDQHITQNKRAEVSDDSSLQCYIFVAVVLLGFSLVGLSVTLIVMFQSTSDSINTLYSRFLNIQSLIIDFTRIMCILRDYASGFILKFPAFNLDYEINQSYSRIQNLKNYVMFTNDDFTINFQNLRITGTLIELVDVILAHVTELLSNGDLSVIQDIHSTYINQLNDMIRNAQSSIYVQVVAQINYINTLSNVVLFCSLGIVVILYFLMILYCFKSNSQLKQSLSNLLYISDSEAHMHQENAEKMKYAVEMIRKNFQIDTQNLLNNDADFKRRKNPKEPIQSREIVYSIAVTAVLGLAVHLSCLFFFQTQFSSQLATFQKMKEQSISTTSSFHNSASLANFVDHKGYINNDTLSLIRGNLTYLQYNLNALVFLPEVSLYIIQLFFTNSCPILTLKFNMTVQECSQTAPGFTISNPFEIGLALYLNRQNYYFFNNLTQDFAHSGVYSGLFAMVLTNLIEIYKGESIRMLGNIASVVNLFNGCIIVINLGYIFAFVVIYYYFRTQFKKIKQILVFFDYKFKSRKIVSEEKEEVQIRNQQISDDSSEEESLIQANEEECPRPSAVSHQKKRSSIEAMKPFVMLPQ